MTFHSNKELYAAVRSLVKKLEDMGASDLASDLRDALGASTLAGEVLGQIRLVFRQIRGHEAYQRLDVRSTVEQGLAELDKALGPP